VAAVVGLMVGFSMSLVVDGHGESDPQYEIKSGKTDHIAVHKGGALTKL
jgi:Hypervirulence associated proteins TUDOR domain